MMSELSNFLIEQLETFYIKTCFTFRNLNVKQQKLS